MIILFLAHVSEQESRQFSTFCEPEINKKEWIRLEKINLINIQNLEWTNLTWVMFGAEFGTHGRGTTKLAKVKVVIIGIGWVRKRWTSFLGRWSTNTIFEARDRAWISCSAWSGYAASKAVLIAALERGLCFPNY